MRSACKYFFMMFVFLQKNIDKCKGAIAICKVGEDVCILTFLVCKLYADLCAIVDEKEESIFVGFRNRDQLVCYFCSVPFDGFDFIECNHE